MKYRKLVHKPPPPPEAVPPFYSISPEKSPLKQPLLEADYTPIRDTSSFKDRKIKSKVFCD